MNHSPLGTDPLRRSLFRKTEVVSSGEITPPVERKAPLILSELPLQVDVLTFYLGTEEFGLEVNKIREIVRLVEITSVPKAPFFVEGIIDLRGEVIPVISLRKMFARGEKGYTLSTQIIITEMDKRAIGLIVDATAEIISLGKEKIKPPVETIPLHNFLFGIAELEGGEHLSATGLLLLLDLNRILSYEQKALLEILTAGFEKITPVEEAKRELTPEQKVMKNILHQRALELSKKKIIEEKEKKQVVVFSFLTGQVGEEFYAVEINQVKEVIKGRKIVYLPSVPDYFSGIINLRGELVPVLNLKELLGLTPHQEVVTSVSSNGKIRIVITQTESIKVGFLVDRVHDVVALTVDSFESPLATIEKGKIDYLLAQTHYQNKILGLLNLENIVKSVKV